jgi:hypothetical protein
MHRSMIVVLAGLTPLLGGCTENFACTTSVEPGVVVEIRDATDGSPLAESARGAVREGTFTDSLRPHGSTDQGVLLSRAAADERAGSYVLVIEHPGYLTFERSVNVEDGGCHVRTVHLAADLERAP